MLVVYMYDAYYAIYKKQKIIDKWDIRKRYYLIKK